MKFTEAQLETKADHQGCLAVTNTTATVTTESFAHA